MKLMKLRSLLNVGALGIISLGASAFPIASPGTEGFLVIAAGSSPVVATYEGNSASYSNDLYLERDGLGNPGIDGNTANDLFLFNNHVNNPGNTASVGTFSAGVELVFRLHVNNTGDNFFSGPGSRNVDGNAHARVQDNWAPGTTLVSFEDLRGGPFVFNDLSFSFSNTRSTPVPDSMSTGLGLGVALIGLFTAARRRKA